MDKNRDQMADAAASVANRTYTDVLLHEKTSDGEDLISFPITRYENLLGSPKVVSDISSFNGASFFFYKKDEVDVPEDVLNTMIGIPMTSSTQSE